MLDLSEELAAYQIDVSVVATNLGVIEAVSRLTADLERRGLADVDVLVNNAGFGDYADFIVAEPTKLAEMIQLNVAALTALTRTFLPGMISRGRGRVLLVGALASFAPGPGAAVYHATKAYVVSLGEALGHELRGTGVTVTTLCPGPTQTGFQDASGQALPPPRPRFGIMLPATVAQQAYEALVSGQRMVVPGLLNKLRAVWLRLVPHALVSSKAGGASWPRQD